MSEGIRYALAGLAATAAFAFLALAFPNMSQAVTIPGAIIAFFFTLYFLWPEIRAVHSRRKHRMIPLIGMVVFGLASIGCAVWYFWPISHVENAIQEPPVPKRPQTLKELLTNDFPNQWCYASDATMESIAGTKDVLQVAIFYDLEANTEFFGAYIAPTPRAYLLALALTDKRKEIMDQLRAEMVVTSKNPGDLAMARSDELTFSGKVYLYIESELSLQEAAALETYYRNKGLSLSVRGPSYAATRWLQDSVSPPQPPRIARDAVWKQIQAAVEARIAGLDPDAKKWLYKLVAGEPPNNVPTNLWQVLERERLVVRGMNKDGVTPQYQGIIEGWFSKNNYKPPP